MSLSGQWYSPCLLLSENHQCRAHILLVHLANPFWLLRAVSKSSAGVCPPFMNKAIQRDSMPQRLYPSPHSGPSSSIKPCCPDSSDPLEWTQICKSARSLIELPRIPANVVESHASATCASPPAGYWNCWPPTRTGLPFWRSIHTWKPRIYVRYWAIRPPAPKLNS